ncbi:hypothetical protein HYQ46_011564 [Verticillium longisporum]|nr:hypothetical protein HYQ46_011564 [Verticillium longisporum]
MRSWNSFPCLTVALDLLHGKAGVPGSSDEPISSTASYDVVKFLNEAEAASGNPFDMVSDSIERLPGGEVTKLDSHEAELAASTFPKPVATELLCGGLTLNTSSLRTQGSRTSRP